MRERESASFTCPKCGTRNRVLADEVGDHPCYKCGWHPDDENEEEAGE